MSMYTVSVKNIAVAVTWEHSIDHMNADLARDVLQGHEYKQSKQINLL